MNLLTFEWITKADADISTAKIILDHFVINLNKHLIFSISV